MPRRKDVTCNACGRTIPYTDAIHSKTTGNHYCKDIVKCETLRRKAAR
jgi:hypothetical protein